MTYFFVPPMVLPGIVRKVQHYPLSAMEGIACAVGGTGLYALLFLVLRHLMGH